MINEPRVQMLSGSEGQIGSGLRTGPAVAASEPEQEQQRREACYGLIAALLRSSPSSDLLQHVATLAAAGDTGNPLSVAMSMLGLAARTSDPAAVDDEFHDLFIGLGRGELVPYASWYLTGFLMERPLGVLRSDLKQLGIERDPQAREPEDHIAALCEVMAILIGEGGELAAQSSFFESHVATWCQRFFNDLSEADSAVFYRTVGRFGAAFFEFEQRYLSMQI